MEKLCMARRYKDMEDGLYSAEPEVVESVCRQLNRKFRAGKFEENRRYFNILLAKCTMKSVPSLSDGLVTISVAVHFCAEQIEKHDDDLKALYRLLLQYERKDLRELDLQVIHAGHALFEIATFLYTHGIDDEYIKWWTENKNLNRLNFMDF